MVIDFTLQGRAEARMSDEIQQPDAYRLSLFSSGIRASARPYKTSI